MKPYEQIKSILDSVGKCKVTSKELGIESIFIKVNDTQIIGYDVSDNSPELFTFEDLQLNMKEDMEVVVTPIPTKPPILPVGTEVIVLDNIRNLKFNGHSLSGYKEHQDLFERAIGEVFDIREVFDLVNGVSYRIRHCGFDLIFPHYCICKVYD